MRAQAVGWNIRNPPLAWWVCLKKGHACASCRLEHQKPTTCVVGMLKKGHACASCRLQHQRPTTCVVGMPKKKGVRDALGWNIRNPRFEVGGSTVSFSRVVSVTL